MEQHLLDFVRRDGRYLYRLRREEQTPEICLEAVRNCGAALWYVLKQTPKICLVAVKDDPWALEFVNEQSPEICLEAVRSNGYAVSEVREQTVQVCVAALARYVESVGCVKIPLEISLKTFLDIS